MAKPRKVIRTKRIYKRRTRHKAVGTILFIVLLVLLVGLGYIVSKEWAKRFGGGAQISSAAESSKPESTASGSGSAESVPVSSEVVSSQPAEGPVLKGTLMSMEDMKKTGDALAAYMQNLKAEGYTAVYVTLKDESGVISYSTANEMALKYGAVSKEPVDLDGIVAAAQSAGLAPVARISALKDPLAAHVKNGNSYGYNNSPDVNWLDDSPKNGGKAWLNPYMENARKYIADLCKEASAKGFQTIVLENVTFPLKNTSQMGTLNEFTTRDQILGQLVSEAQTAAGDARVFAAFDVRMLAEQGPNYILALGRNLAPVMDQEAAEAKRQAIGQKVESGSGEFTARQVLSYMIDRFVQDGGELLPLIPQNSRETAAAVLAEKKMEESILF